MKLSELPGWFQTQRQFTILSPESQRSYLRHLKQGIAHLGENESIRSVRAEDADSLFLSIQNANGKHSAVSTCRILRRVWNVALRYRHVSRNPFEKMGLPALPKRTVLWTEDEVWDFYNTAVKRNRQSIGLLAMLCYVFSQRPVDMRQLEWVNLRNGTLTFVQQKTRETDGEPVRLHCPDFLSDILEPMRRKVGYIVINEDTGKPYGPRDYNKVFSEVKRAARINMSLHMRDLRRTGFTEMGDSGATDQELLAHGHMSRGTLDIYTRRSVTQSRHGMEKRFKNFTR